MSVWKKQKQQAVEIILLSFSETRVRYCSSQCYYGHVFNWEKKKEKLGDKMHAVMPPVSCLLILPNNGWVCVWRVVGGWGFFKGKSLQI